MRRRVTLFGKKLVKKCDIYLAPLKNLTLPYPRINPGLDYFCSLRLCKYCCFLLENLSEFLLPDLLIFRHLYPPDDEQFHLPLGLRKVLTLCAHLSFFCLIHGLSLTSFTPCSFLHVMTLVLLRFFSARTLKVLSSPTSFHRLFGALL
jgi:hypothetical protein